MSKVSDSKILSQQSDDYDKNLRNIISIENFDGNNPNIKQSKRSKGKLYLGSNFNAYNRENLGSIPRKTENVLIRDKNNPIKLGFSSNTGRFEQKPQKVKYNYPGPGSYLSGKELDTTANSLNTTSRSSKGFGGGFISKVNRFDDLKEFNDKYAPCPTQYKKERVLSMDANITNSIFCKSLYNKTETKSLKPVLIQPGPGYYDPKKTDFNIDASKTTNNFKSDMERFNKTFQDSKVGPATYFNSDDNIHKVFAKPSYFFYEETKREEPIIEKYLNVKKAYTKYAVPGPGQYNSEKYTNIETKFEQENSKHKRAISTSDAIRNKTVYSNCNQDFYETKSIFDYAQQKGISSPFLSKTSHDTGFRGKVFPNPGPSYYTPSLIPDKLSFNCNVEKKFI